MHTSTGYTGHSAMVSPNCVLRWMTCQPVGIRKKQNAFSAWWCRMGSHHRGQNFCLPGHPAPTLGSLCCLLDHEFFSFCGHIQHCGLSIIDLAYSQKQSIIDHVEWPDLACQRHKIIVRHIFYPCQTLWSCMYLNLRPLVWLGLGRSTAKASTQSHPPLKQCMSQIMSKNLPI